MAENNQQTVDIGAARTFLTSVGHSPDAVKGMQDPDVVKVYTQATGYLDKEYAPKRVAFGEKWREALAGDDKDALENLKRFTDPTALHKSYREVHAKISKGELKPVTAFPAKGTPEEQAAWRKDNGVPEAPDKYDIKLENNITIGKDDEPMVQDFLKYAHGLNWSNEQAKGALQWYFGNYMVNNQKMQSEADGEFRQETQGMLAQKWGTDYKRNLQAVANFVQRAPEALRERLWGGRLADGRPIGDDPEMLQWFADMELNINPQTTWTGKEGAPQMKAAQDRIKEIEGLMKSNRSAYNKDSAMQEEYRNLVDAVARVKDKEKTPA